MIGVSPFEMSIIRLCYAQIRCVSICQPFGISYMIGFPAVTVERVELLSNSLLCSPNYNRFESAALIVSLGFISNVVSKSSLDEACHPKQFFT